MFYTLSIPAQQKWAEKEGLSCNKEINEESGNKCKSKQIW